MVGDIMDYGPIWSHMVTYGHMTTIGCGVVTTCDNFKMDCFPCWKMLEDDNRIQRISVGQHQSHYAEALCERSQGAGFSSSISERKVVETRKRLEKRICDEKML